MTTQQSTANHLSPPARTGANWQVHLHLSLRPQRNHTQNPVGPALQAVTVHQLTAASRRCSAQVAVSLPDSVAHNPTRRAPSHILQVCAYRSPADRSLKAMAMAWQSHCAPFPHSFPHSQVENPTQVLADQTPPRKQRGSLPGCSQGTSGLQVLGDSWPQVRISLGPEAYAPTHQAALQVAAHRAPADCSLWAMVCPRRASAWVQ